MTVAKVLSTKGREVVTIAPERTLAEAAHTLAHKRIGAIVVTGDGGAVRGIISERDIVRALAVSGGAALDAPVSQHMTHEVVTCTERSDVPRVMEMMTTGKFRHVPVVEGGRLVGIVSIGDVVKHRLAEIEAESQALREYIATA